MWQKGTNHGAIVGLGGPSAMSQNGVGVPAVAAINGPGGPIHENFPIEKPAILYVIVTP